MLTGDATQADPVCSKSPYHQQLVDEVEQLTDLESTPTKPLIFRNMKNSKEQIKSLKL